MKKHSYIHILRGESMVQDTKMHRLAQMFDCLGDVNRLEIVVYLTDGEKSVSDIVSHLGMTQSAVSHQLRILKDARILKATKIGKAVYYSINDHHVETIVRNGLTHMFHGE